jgi:hypothetical protein
LTSFSFLSQSSNIFQTLLDKVVELYDASGGVEILNELLPKLQKKLFPQLGEAFRYPPSFFPLLISFPSHSSCSPFNSIQVQNPFTGTKDIMQLSNTIETESSDMRALLCTLNINNVLTIFISLITERRVIFYSNSVTTLSGAVQAAVDLIAPLSWQHIYIPGK